MNIAIIGTGRVGSALGEGWAATGHRVVYRQSHAPRRPGAGAAGSLSWSQRRQPRDAVSSAEGGAAGRPLHRRRRHRHSPRTGRQDPHRRHQHLRQDPDAPSGAEDLAVHAPGALVAKAFNVTGADNMRDPTYGGEALTMFVWGEARARGGSRGFGSGDRV